VTVSVQLRRALLAEGSNQVHPIAVRFFDRFADIAEDHPADALCCLLLMMQTRDCSPEECEVTLQAVGEVLDRYEPRAGGAEEVRL
jgi:hypothetical protein